MIASRLPVCPMPDQNEISEEGFGSFRGTWFIGRMPIRDAERVVGYEGRVLEALDYASSRADDFERLAMAAEGGDGSELPDRLGEVFESSGLGELTAWDDDIDPLGSLEIGVAGLTCSLSAIRCLTAASCRSHITERSWSDCPIVFFAAPAWRVELLADLIARANCGLDADRGMLKIYGRSVRNMHDLAQAILDERELPKSSRSPSDQAPAEAIQCSPDGPTHRGRITRLDAANPADSGTWCQFDLYGVCGSAPCWRPPKVVSYLARSCNRRTTWSCSLRGVSTI